MLPLLTLAADFAGLMMGWLAQALVEPLSLRQFIDTGFHGAKFSAFLPPTFKTAVFGLIIGLIACFQGMRTREAQRAWAVQPLTRSSWPRYSSSWPTSFW